MPVFLNQCIGSYLQGDVVPPLSTKYNIHLSELPNYDIIIPSLLEKGVAELDTLCKLTPGNFFLILGTPVKPMLAHPTKSLSEVLTRFENTKFICEYKYDGERAQVNIF